MVVKILINILIILMINILQLLILCFMIVKILINPSMIGIFSMLRIHMENLNDDIINNLNLLLFLNNK